MDIRELQREFKLSELKHNEIYQAIKDEIIGVKSVINHKCNLIIGQSGAGKSTYSNILQLQDSSLIVINGDQIRSFHPSSSLLMSQYPKDYCYIILDDWLLWRNRLIQDILQKGYYFNFETTMNEPKVYHRFISNLQANNYQFNISVLAISYMESKLRMLERFFSSFSLSGTGRLIDSCYQKKSVENIKNHITCFDYPELLNLEFLDYHFKQYLINPGAIENTTIYENIITMSSDFLNNNFKERVNKILEFYQLYRNELDSRILAILNQQLAEVCQYFAIPLDSLKRIKNN